MDDNINRNVSGSAGVSENVKQGQSTFQNVKENIPNIEMPSNLDPKSNINYKMTNYQESKDQPIDRLIIGDHTLVKTIYDKFKMCSHKEANEWRNQLIYEIARHSVAEELIIYPIMREKIPDGEKWYQDSIKDHQKVKQLLHEVQSIDPSSTELRSKVDETMKVLFSHIEEEENEILPLIRKHIPEEQLVTAGNQFMRRKFIVPTRPHSSVPEDPPTLEGLLGLLIAPVDKFRELFTSYPDQDKVADMTREAIDFAQNSTKSKSICESGQCRH